MTELITESLVIQAAREWSTRKNKSETTAVANASETMAALKARLSKKDYGQALVKLYKEYKVS